MKQNILFLATHPMQPTGYARIAHKLSNYLADQDGYNFYYFAFQNYKNTIIKRDISKNIHFIDVEEVSKTNMLNDSFGVSLLTKYIHELKIDILFIYNDILLSCRIFNELLKIPKTFKTILYIDLVYNYERNVLIQHAAKFTDLFFVFSEYWVNDLKNQGVSENKIKVLPHGISDNVYPLDKILCRNELKIDENDFIILNTNRNAYRKGWDISIHSFLLAYKNLGCPDNFKFFINCHFMSDYGHNIIELIKLFCQILELDYQHIINHNILRLPKNGYLSDKTINYLYNASDVGLNTCLGEGFGLCNIEHASVGCVQVVSKVGAFHDNLPNDLCFKIDPITKIYIAKHIDEHGGFGYITRPEDIADKLEYIYNYRYKFETNSLLSKTIRDKFNWDTILKQFYNDFKLYTK
jgi:D-inositol-3-phosphate glycosyltransferase